ncbi:hypothetical protein K470DRAFT_254845 [Piedraia hortae CBS 480.64]|uniref:Uncharacterized protein n=1 Tax=Piedraia hortae CBS 480.64 TaxID=1314780 RepID=A0A6A7C900_9PEZI|nr:hypothetical protein K470DRAFT_254845 [Piedraia hortae CBS 480.64]
MAKEAMFKTAEQAEMQAALVNLLLATADAYATQHGLNEHWQREAIGHGTSRPSDSRDHHLAENLHRRPCHTSPHYGRGGSC